MNEETSNEITDEEFSFATALAEERNGMTDTARDERNYLRERRPSAVGAAKEELVRRAKQKVKQAVTRALLRVVAQLTAIVLLNPFTWIILVGGAVLLVLTFLVIGAIDCVSSLGCWKGIGIQIGKGLGSAAWDGTLGQIGIPGTDLNLGRFNPLD